MKADVDDRLIDHALRELHRPEDQVDLSERIADAWSRGERGEDLTDVIARDVAPPPAPVAPAPLPVAPSRDWKYVAAAAVVVLGLGFLAWLRWRPGAERPSSIAPIASADLPLRIFRDGAGAAIESTRLVRGDIVVLGDTQAAGVTFASRERIVLGPCSVLTWVNAPDVDSEGLALDRGRVEVATADRAVALELGFARALIEPHSRIAAAFVFEDTALACTPIVDAGALNAAILASRDAPRRVRVSVASGALELTHDGTRERLTAGSDLEVWSAPDRLVSADKAKALLMQLDEVILGPKLAPFAGMQRAWEERNVALDLSKWLAERPQYWPVLRENVLALAAKHKLEGYSGQRLLGFLMLAGTPQAFDLTRELWLASPAMFREREIVLLAERGAPELEVEARAMVDRYDPAAGPPPVLAAASLAIRGDREASEILSRFLEKAEPPATPEEFDRVAIAAYTLDAGGDERAWSRGMEAITPYIQDLLRRGGQPAAGHMALCVRLLHEARRDRRLLSPAGYIEETFPYVSAHESEVASASDVRALLEVLQR